MKNLDESRKTLDQIDSQIVDLLENRMKISKEIGIYKLNNNLNTEDSSREDKIIKKLENKIAPEFKNSIRPIYSEIFSESKKIITKVKNENFKYGLIGENLSHSKSKEIHELFGKYNYNLKDLKKSDVESFLENKNFIGINVTIPYKEISMKYLNYVDDLAREIGAVNTIVNRAGKLIGYNTDYFGFDYSLNHFDINIKDKKVLILGSGGASKMIQKLARDKGAESVIVISRSGENNYETLDKFKDYNILINATPVGMYPNNMECKVDLDKFQDLESVIDLIYNPLNTKLILDAKRLGLKTMSGLLMLVVQAFFAAELFLDEKLDKCLIKKVYLKLKRDMQNIVFVGMPSAGKTTMAMLLSEKLNREFFDTDKLIEEREGKIPEIFKNKGEKYFREVETKILNEVSKKTGVVIATGGGTPLKEINRDLILQNSLVIYLDRDLKNLETEGRPLSKNLDNLKKMYEIRHKIYEDISHIKIKVIEDKEKNLEKILEKIKNYEDFSN
ncbi:shikimate kinase [Peptoniphilus sp.]|uniref:shikimate kinase n=1 Tax=Peptoniphilus sp. TaxID=1971214 RepID=UPI002A824EA2|nr:shikimate kinase [Peptoniphilus sp.]MDY3902737.1 shikimate kinase [Peptoniphilus sp.]